MPCDSRISEFRLSGRGCPICLRLHAGRQRRLSQQKVAVTEDDHEQVVEVVGDAAGEPPQALHFLRSQQLLLQALVVGDIEEGNDDARPVSGRRLQGDDHGDGARFAGEGLGLEFGAEHRARRGEHAHFLAHHLVGRVVENAAQVAQQLLAGGAVKLAGGAIHVEHADAAHALLGVAAMGGEMRADVGGAAGFQFVEKRLDQGKIFLPHGKRRVLEQGAIALLADAQGLFRHAPLGDFALSALDADLAAALVEDGSPGSGHPLDAPIPGDQPVLFVGVRMALE
ncbi:MAG: hypothetical protein ABSC05_05470 [Candidatus Solibacter sp.]|jgi:hypothetical protein